MNTTCWQWDTCPMGSPDTGAWIVHYPGSCVDLTVKHNQGANPPHTEVVDLTDIGTWSFPGWDGAVLMWESTDCSGVPVAPLPIDMPLCTGAPYDFNFAGLILGRTDPKTVKVKSMKYMGCSASS